jgi:hypothetical protein
LTPNKKLAFFHLLCSPGHPVYEILSTLTSHSTNIPYSIDKMSVDDIKKQHHNEALASLEDGQPLIYRPSDVESEATLINPGSRGSLSPRASPPQRRGRRSSNDRFKTMSMASSLGVGITSLTFTGSNVPTGDFGQGQYGCYDDFNVVNLRASQHLGVPKENSPVRFAHRLL